MLKRLKSDERGLAHVAIIVIVIAVIGAVGFVGWRMTQKKDSNTTVENALKEASKEAAAECKKQIDDKDLCKFFSSWGDMKKFSINSTDTTEGVTTKSTMTFDDGKTYMKTEGGETGTYEVIVIGDATYTKAGDVWWKQTAQTPQEVPKTDDFKLDEPDETQPEAAQTKYENQGKEACGSLQCFKYKVIDPENTGSTEYIWFDDKDYMIRKSRTESTDSVSEQVYSYENISVTEPSPVKELAPNQYIMPGQTEPSTIPTQ